MKVEWLQTARDDRIRITLWLRQRNPAAAIRTVRALSAAADSLASFPGRGRPGRTLDTRELLAVRPYVIVYRIEPETGAIQILRIWHGAQNRPATEQPLEPHRLP